MKPIKLAVILVLFSLTALTVRNLVYSTSDSPGIPLQSHPRSIAIDPMTDRAVVATEKPDSLLVIDLSTGQVISKVTMGKKSMKPRGVALDHDLNVALMVNSSSSSVSVIDLGANKVTASIPVGLSPLGIAINPISHVSLVTNYKGNSVSVVNLLTNTVIETIPVGISPSGVAIHPDFNLALVTSEKENNVYVIDLDTYETIETIPVGKRPGAVSINPENHFAAVVNQKGNSLTIIDLLNWETTTIPTSKGPLDVTINPLDNRALVMCGKGMEILVIDLDTKAVINHLPINPTPKGIAVNPFTNIAGVVDDKTDSLTLIELTNPIPVISSVTPSSLLRGSGSTGLVIEGSGFLKTSTVSFLGTPPRSLPVNFVDNHHIETVLSEELLSQAGTFQITVTNPAPDGGTSDPVNVQINNPAPAISMLNPSEVTAGTAGLSVTVTGTGFFNDTILYVNGKSRPFTLLSKTELRVSLSTEDLEVGSYLQLTASNPAPGGGSSSPLVFTVLNPVPSLSSINPSSIMAGSPGFTLALTGDGFVRTSLVSFNNQQVPTGYVNKNNIEATISADAIKTAGSYPVKVISPGPGGGETNSLAFIVTTPFEVTDFTPKEGSIGTSVTIYGNNLDAGGTRVGFNGVPAVISKLTGTSITTSVPMGATTGPIAVMVLGSTVNTAGDFTVTPLNDFTISANPEQTTVAPGSQVTYTVSVTGNEGFSSLVALNVYGLPDGFSGRFSPKTITSGQSSTLTISACDCSLGSPATLTITGSATIEGRTAVRSASVSLGVLVPGLTTLVGRVLDTDAKPIKNVTIRVADSSTTTDESGNFLLENPPIGDQVVLIDGFTASTDAAKYPTIPITMNIIPAQTNSLPYVPHLHAQKNYNFTPINPAKETRVEDPEIPGLQMRIPPGVDIIGWDGEVNTKVSARKVPIDALPVPPTPPQVQARSVYMFYFDKQGGGVPTTPIPVTVPNDMGLKPGEKAELWYFNESPNVGEAPNEWNMAGIGTVSADGKTITTDPGVGIPRFCCGAIVWTPRDPTGPNIPPPDDRCKVGNYSVEPSTGVFIHSETDLSITGRIPITVTRHYRSLDTFRGPYGIGTYFSYDWYLLRSGDMATLIIPPGSRISFNRQTDGSYINANEPSYRGARVILNSDGTSILRMKDGLTYKFDTNGLLVEEADRNGNKLTFLREVEGNVTEIIGPDGRIMVTFSIIIMGRDVITEMTDVIGRTTTYTYDYSADPGTGRLVSVTNPAGGVTRYTYDAQGRMTSIIDPRGNTAVTISFDVNGRVCQEQYADGGAHKYYYLTADQATTPWAMNLLTEAAAGGPITLPKCSAVASNSPIAYTIVVDPNGDPTTYRFNNAQKIISVTDASGQTGTSNTDPVTNQVTARTDALGRTTTYTYDSNGNMTSITDPDGNVTHFEYEPTYNLLTEVTDPLGNVTQYHYDSKGNITKIIDAMAHETTMVYNEQGQVISTTNPLGNTTRFEYDDYGNSTATIDSMGNRIIRKYDEASRLLYLTNPLGRTTIALYNNLNKVTETTDALGSITKLEYDQNGNLLRIIDTNGGQVIYTYDKKNRLTAITDQLGNSETYAYDSNNNLIRFTDRNGQPRIFTYDSLNRKSRVDYADGSYTAYVYDAGSRLIRIFDSISGPIEYEYENLGVCKGCGTGGSEDKVEREITALGNIEYEYDALGRRKSMRVNGQEPVEYRYNRNSLLTDIIHPTLGIVNIGYDDANRRESLTLPNGIVTKYSFDNASRLLIMNYTKNSETVENVSYSADATGNRTSFGRINPQVPMPEVANATYNEVNQVLTFIDKTFTYDKNGNMRTVRDTCGTTNYIWDVRDRLIEINGFTSGCRPLTASFKYDAMNRRIQKTINGRTIEYIYDGNDIVAEIENGVLSATYIRSLNIDEVFGRDGAEGTRYFIVDGLGSVMGLIDGNGLARTTYVYDPYGNTTISGDIDNNPFQYTGRENDGTGLYYYRSRYYDPKMGRFLQVDPIGYASRDVNLYRYVFGDPINYRDSFGRQVENYRSGGIGISQCKPAVNRCESCITKCIEKNSKEPLSNIQTARIGVALIGCALTGGTAFVVCMGTWIGAPVCGIVGCVVGALIPQAIPSLPLEVGPMAGEAGVNILVRESCRNECFAQCL